ncbi:cupin domain-containing protein [Nocardia amikacinitolerans]|uniref:cupin domain-containing protein n=1 Tax=Nocardia amikacinitolerans TaxID=756689 RepID=UPI0020A3E4EE|nr:cupin domain-containing protein [Nocardia amikacinitolerans]MCP2280828.1 Cupin domain-containing protein [Nocardia amikacinitolerans]MCP2299860.1 Cupin domain-containing protein [Nocardia amikacinitolerans]
MADAPFRNTDDLDRAIWHFGSLIQFDATAEQTGGRFAITRHTCLSGTAAPLHRHTREDELFIVVHGRLDIHIDGRRYHAAAGSITYAPKGLPHAYRAVSPTCQFLTLIAPAGFEQWFTETGTAAASLALPPTPTGPPDITALTAAAARRGVEILGPPPSSE